MNFLYWISDHPKETALVSVLTALLFSTIINVLRNLAVYVFKFFFPHKIISDDETLKAIANYLKAHGKSFGISDEDTIGFKKTVVPENGVSFTKFLFGIQVRFSYRLFLLGATPILLLPTVLSNDDTRKYSTLVYFRWSLNWKDFLTKCALHFDEDHGTSSRNRFKVTSHGAGGSNELTSRTKEFDMNDQVILINDIDVKLAELDKSGRLSKMSLTEGMKKVLRDFKFWIENEQWYRRTGVPWKRGYLLYGITGSGKTSLIRAMAEHYDIPVHMFNLASMSNEDLQNAWDEAKTGGLRFCVFEDFDTVFKGRQNISEGKLSFDAVLNIMDGILKEEGLVVFVTTNHLEHIDSAMGIPDMEGRSSRPGRIDLSVEIGLLSAEGRHQMALRILQDAKLAQKMWDENPDVTGAQFQEFCVQVAKERLWQNFNS